VHTLLKLLGWVLLVPGGLLLLMTPVVLFDADAGENATAGVIMLAAMFGAPGGLLLRAGITRQRESSLQDQLVGFVRSHESFSLEELGAHLGKTPAEAQTMLHRDIAKYQLPLIMHRASRRYMRLDRLSRAGQVADRCQSCGGAIDPQILFEGEQLTCPYCGTLVVTQASAQAYQQPHYQPSQYQPPQHQQQPPNQGQGGPWGHG
jgi:predicted RNA-binding Zn-ribbon protein involved in translation (DUF1610 family)